MKHWYNNQIIEKCLEECPEGWQVGRLPISEETRQKHKDNNGMHHLSDDQKKARSEKLKKFNREASIDFKQHKAKAISDAKVGKYKGRTPWNKGKSGLQKAWNKNLRKETPAWNKGISPSLETRIKLSLALKGREPWNKGKKLGTLPLDVVSTRNKKQYATKLMHGSFNTSSQEALMKTYLEEKYGVDDILCQYKDERYPFSCDFYIKSLDTFIELNLSWTHGGHPFDITNETDIKQLAAWKEKAKNSEYYQNAITTWTVRDINKIQKAKDNKLNYILIYDKEDMYAFI